MPYVNWGVRDITNSMKEMQDNKFDCIVLITGRRGLGKSTLAVKLASRFKQFKLRRDIVFGRDDVMEHLAKKKRGVILADELINVTYNRDFYNENQKKILKMLNMYRDSSNIFISCVPNFSDIDKQLRSLVKFRVDVIRRGMGVIHVPKQNSFSSDMWDIKLNEKIEQGFSKRGLFKPNYSKLTTFKGFLAFGDLAPNQRQIYEEVKKEKRNHIVEEEDKKEKSDNPYDRLYEKVKKGMLTKEGLQQFCLLNDWKYNNVYALLSKRAKDEGTLMSKIFSTNAVLKPNNLIVNRNDDNLAISV